MAERYDAVVIGAGVAGEVCAGDLADGVKEAIAMSRWSYAHSIAHIAAQNARTDAGWAPAHAMARAWLHLGNEVANLWARFEAPRPPVGRRGARAVTATRSRHRGTRPAKVRSRNPLP